MEGRIRLGDIFTLVGGGTPSTSTEAYWGNGTPWFSSADISLDGKIICRRAVTPLGIKNSTTNIVPAQTVVVVTRVGLGKVVKLPCDMCFSQDMQALQPMPQTPPYNESFLSYELTHIMKRVKFQGRGTTISGITKKQLSDVILYLPSLVEQERIVARIEELFSQLDASVAELKKAKERLKVYRQAVLKEAFEGTLTGSEKIGMAPLGNYVEKPRYGTSKKCGYTQTEKSVEVYRIPNIDYATGQVSHQDIKYSEFSDDELAQITLKCGDILIIRSNGSVSLVGRAALIREIDIKGTFAGYLMRLRLKDKSSFLPEFLLYFLQSHQARIYIENKAKSTSGVHNINSTEISGLMVPIFRVDAQQCIVSALESRLSVCDSIEKTVDTALQQAEALRQSILKKAFEGRLV